MIKQHITKKQWDELSIKKLQSLKEFWKDKDIDKFNNIYREQNDYDEPEVVVELPEMNIGQMIEFLGDDLMDMSNELGNWWITHDDKLIHTEKLELVDALWAAVKYKLKNL